MDNGIREVFDKIRAEDSLKRETDDFLHEKIQRQSSKKNTVRLRLAVVCVSFTLLFIIGGFSYNLYFTPSAYVDIDVNPSIELVVNRFGRVIDARPYNDDGAAVLENIGVRHMRYGDAVDKLIGVLTASGYLKPDGLLSVTVQTGDGKRESSMVGGLQTVIDNSLQAHHASVSTNIFPVSEEVKSHAHESHITPAKYLAISELQKLDPTATFEDCRNHTISEIKQMIQEHGDDHHSETPADEGREQQYQPIEEDCEAEEHPPEQNESGDNSRIAPDNHDSHENKKGEKKHGKNEGHH